MDLGAVFETSFGVILAPSQGEQINILLQACGGDENDGFACPLTTNFSFKIDYTEGTSELSETITIPSSNETVNYTITLEDAIGHLADVTTKGTNMLVVTFRGEIQKVVVNVLKV